ncbi:MAG: hypothetical protein HYZ68_04960 [Chloroflexi bacterium]|nr:hypothetical protein [Chloroflexota bacterium]
MKDDTSILRLLAADGPHPAYADKMMLFGQFVGSWDLDMKLYDSDGSSRSLKGVWHFGWVLEGRAIQDVLIPHRPEGGMGTTLRFYDPRIDAWRVVWAGPADGEFSTLVARQVGDQIFLEGTWSIAAEHRLWQWRFSEITETSFHWQGVVSDDGGQTWRLVEEMYARRRTGRLR